MTLKQQIICNSVDRFIVATSKLPAASTLFTKGMVFANVHIIAIKALRRHTVYTSIANHRYLCHMALAENLHLTELKFNEIVN